MATNNETRECPFCKEEIKADAIKCKHCRSTVKPKTPSHGGVCPYCKEEIKPDAIKCKHCGSMVGSTTESCCDDCGQKQESFRSAFQEASINNPGTRFPFQLLPETLNAQKESCSECGSFGRFRFRICCVKVWIPFLGIVNVCYPEPCAGFDGGVYTA